MTLFDQVKTGLTRGERLELDDSGNLLVESQRFDRLPFCLTWHPSRLEIEARGDIDLYTCPLVGLLVDAVAETAPRHLHLDLSQVHYLDACGVATLMRCQLKLRRLGARLAVTGISGQVSRVLQLLGLRDLLAETVAVA